MPGVAATNAATNASPGLGSSEVDHLLATATSGGQLHTFALAQEVSKLAPSEQGPALKALDARLSPQQQGEVRRGLETIKSDAGTLPPQYQRNVNGKLEFTPAYTRQACANYHALMESNDSLGAKFGFPTAAAGTVAGASTHVRDALGGRLLGPAGVMASIVGLVTSATDLGAKPPPGCEK